MIKTFSSLIIPAAALSLGAAPAHAAGDPVAGKAIYAQCAACHKAQAGAPNGIGPNLWKVVGRKAGTVPGFAYSQAMKTSGKVWNDATLNAYLAAPAKAMPGTRMPYAGLPKPADRANLIAYLRTLK